MVATTTGDAATAGPWGIDCRRVPRARLAGHAVGYPIGGWSKSWAYWIYNGTGGPVCTRTVEEIPNDDGTNRLVLDTNP